MKDKKVAVAVSGGIDSGVAAALLAGKGFKATAFHMQLWHEEERGDFRNKCCDLASLEAARKTAAKLKIPFYTIDFSKIFKKKVVDYFLREYAVGNTPNPCVMCNKLIKFGQLLDYVLGLGFDYLATGHYARIKKDEVYHLLTGEDKKKDQSYFLYNLTQERLAHILFPLGDLKKEEVVRKAEKLNLPVARRPESQEVCFFPENDYRPFLKRQIKEKIVPGKVLNSKGEVIGTHLGLPLYTIGQRHGFKVNKKKANGKGIIPPFYVIRKNIENNSLIVGFGEETETASFRVKSVNWINPFIRDKDLLRGIRVQSKIRYQGELLNSRVKKEKAGLRVILDNSQRGISSGQAVVFYKKDEVLGGGVICSH